MAVLAVLSFAATDLLKQSIANRTELGLVAEELLLRGELIDSALVLRILEAKMKDGVSHQGYVLDGFPTLLDDPDGATSASAMDIGAQIDLLKSFPLQPDFIVHIRVRRLFICICDSYFLIFFLLHY